MSANGEAASTTAPSFEKFSFSFSKPSLLSRLDMNQSAIDSEPSSSAGPTSTIISTSDSQTPEAPELTTSGATSISNTRYSSITQAGDEESNGIISRTTNPMRNGLERDLAPRPGSPTAMEVDINGDPEIVEISSSHSSIPASYRNLPATHYFVAPPAALPYPRSPVRRFPEGHPLHTQPSLFGHLRAPPRSPRLDPLQILELESARERNEWEQVCNDLGRTRLERSSSSITQPHSVIPSVPQTQVNGNTNKATSQAPPSEDDYDSDSSDVELRIYNADPIDEIQTPSQPDSVPGTLPPTPLGARPPIAQLLPKPNGSAAHRSILERLSQPSTPKPSGPAPETAADRSTGSPKSNTTPAKRKIDDVEPVASEPSAKRKSSPAQQPPSALQQSTNANERNGVPPPLRAQVDQTPSSSVPQAPVRVETTRAPQAITSQPTPAPSTSTTASSVAKSGIICRFHNRPPGRVCVRKDQCPDLHIGELQKPAPGASVPSAPGIEPSSSTGALTPPVIPPVTAPPLSRTPTLANAPPLGTNPSPPPRPARPPCRYFSRPSGCARGNSCPFGHGTNEPASRPLAPSPMPANPVSTTIPTPAPIPVHVGPKVPLPATAASSVPTPTATRPPAASVVPAPTAVTPPAQAPTVSVAAPAPITTSVATHIQAPQPVGTIRIPQTPAHPLPAKPTPATTSAATAQQASAPQTKGKGKGKGKAAQGTPATPNATKSNANQANAKVKTEPETPKATKRKASGSQPKPQPVRVNTAAREIKQEEITLIDLLDDSPQEIAGSSVLPPELTGSRLDMQAQSRTEAAQAQATQVQPRVEVVQPQPRPIIPLPTRAAPAPTSTPTNTTLLPLNRPPPPPYRPPPPNPSPSTLSQAPPPPISTPVVPATTAPSAPIVPATAVIPPTPARPIPEQSNAKAPVVSAANGPTKSAAKVPAATSNASTTQASNTLKAPAPSVSKSPAPSTTTPIPAATASTDRLNIPVPPRPKASPVPPRPDLAADSSPPQAQTQSRPRSRQASREPVRPTSRGQARRTSPEPPRRDTRDPPRRNSRDPERRSLMTRINSYRPASRSRSPPRRHYSPPPPRRRSPPRGRSPSPARYRDWRSRSRSPVRRPLRERFGPRANGPPRRSRSRSWSPARYSRSPSRSPMYRSPRSRSRSFSSSRSPSPPPPRQHYLPRPVAPADGYTNGSAYFPPENHIPRAWEAETGGNRPTSNEVYSSSPSETMVIVDEPTQNSTPPPANAMGALNDYDSFNQTTTMEISPMSSPARVYTGGGLGNRISDHPPAAANPQTTNSYSEQRENLLTRMTVEPDLANRLAPVSKAPTRAPPAGKSTKNTRTQAHQAPLADRLGGGDSYSGQASRNDRQVRGGRLMGRMTGQ